MTSKTSDDSGITLLETVLAIAISALVMGAAYTVWLVSARSADQARAQITATSEEQTLAIALRRDVTSANTFTANDQPGFPAPAVPAGCGPTTEPMVVQFTGTALTEPASEAARTTIAYVLTDGGTHLHRRVCRSPATTPVSDTVLATVPATSPPVAGCLRDGATPIACADPDATTVALKVTTTGGRDATTIMASKRTTP